MYCHFRAKKKGRVFFFIHTFRKSSIIALEIINARIRLFADCCLAAVQLEVRPVNLQLPNCKFVPFSRLRWVCVSFCKLTEFWSFRWNVQSRQTHFSPSYLTDESRRVSLKRQLVFCLSVLRRLTEFFFQIVSKFTVAFCWSCQFDKARQLQRTEVDQPAPVGSLTRLSLLCSSTLLLPQRTRACSQLRTGLINSVHGKKNTRHKRFFRHYACAITTTMPHANHMGETSRYNLSVFNYMIK